MCRNLSRIPAALIALSMMGAAAAPALAWTNPDVNPFTSFRLFSPQAQMSADGRRIVVAGTADCGPVAGEVRVAVSVLQQAGLAAARGFSTPQPCTEAEDSFSADLTVREGKPAFTAGPVQTCGFALMRDDQGITDADYNAARRHSTLGYLSPVEFERQAALA